MFSLQTKSIKNDKEFLVTILVVLFCLVLSVIFPINNSIEGLTRSFFFFFAVPAFYIKYVLRKDVGDFGLNFRNFKTGIIWGIAATFGAGALICLAVNYTEFPNNYFISDSISGNFLYFIVGMLVLTNILAFFQEFFFRGFILFFLSPRIGWWSVLIQAGAYFFLALVVSREFGKGLWQFFPYIVLSLSGGIVAFKSRSLVYSWIFGMLFLIILNSYIIYTIK